MCTYAHTYACTYIHAYIHTDRHTYVLYIHFYNDTFVHSYIHPHTSTPRQKTASYEWPGMTSNQLRRKWSNVDGTERSRKGWTFGIRHSKLPSQLSLRKTVWVTSACLNKEFSKPPCSQFRRLDSSHFWSKKLWRVLAPTRQIPQSTSASASHTHARFKPHRTRPCWHCSLPLRLEQSKRQSPYENLTRIARVSWFLGLRNS